jgi:Secretion system C-terminal sorting domain/SprB repeat
MILNCATGNNQLTISNIVGTDSNSKLLLKGYNWSSLAYHETKKIGATYNVTFEDINLSGNYFLYLINPSNCQKLIDSFVFSFPLLLDSIDLNPIILDHINCSTDSGLYVYTAYQKGSLYSVTDTLVVYEGQNTISIYDSNGCVIKKKQFFYAYQPSISIINVSPPSCNGSNTSVLINVISNDSVISGAGIISVPTGYYNTTIQFASGCTYSYSINIPNPINPFQVNSPTVLIPCNGSSVNLVPVISNGLAPFVINPNSFSNTGVYTFTVTDANGCTTTNTVTVAQDSIAVSLASSPIACYGNNASISVNASGGTLPYTGVGNFYSLANVQNNFLVTDANGCTGNASIILSQPDSIQISTVSNPILCNGGFTNVYPTSTGGTGVITFPGFNNILFVGNYTINAIDANGCTSSLVINLPEPSALQFTNVSSTYIGGNTGVINATVSGGTPQYTYVLFLFNNSTWDTVGVYNALPISNLTFGKYKLLVLDQNNCSIEIPFTLQPSFIETNKTELFNCKIFPNPGSNYFEANLPKQSEYYSVNILNSVGQLVMSKHIKYNQKVFVHDLKDGLYFVYFIDKNGNSFDSTWIKQE